jgi:hypothetical protein
MIDKKALLPLAESAMVLHFFTDFFSIIGRCRDSPTSDFPGAAAGFQV